MRSSLPRRTFSDLGTRSLPALGFAWAALGCIAACTGGRAGVHEDEASFVVRAVGVQVASEHLALAHGEARTRAFDVRGPCVRQANRLTLALESGREAARDLAYGLPDEGAGRAALVAWRTAEPEACAGLCAELNAHYCEAAVPVRDRLEEVLRQPNDRSAWEAFVGAWSAWREALLPESVE